MKPEIRELLETRESSRARRPSIRYRKGNFEVVIPEEMDLDVERFVDQNMDWIRKYMPRAREYREKTPERSFQEGGKISVLGTEREIRIEKRRTGKVTENKIFLAEHLVERNSVKERVRENLKKFARKVFEEKSEKFTGEIDGNYEKIFLKNQETRWGSCSGKNNLNFNWRLILGPEKVLEYVIVHELVHLETLRGNFTGLQESKAVAG